MGDACKVGTSLFQINSGEVGGTYAAPLLLEISAAGCGGNTLPVSSDRLDRRCKRWCGRRAGVNLFQINGRAVGGTYAAPLLLGISKRSLVAGSASTPAYATWSGWHADTMFSLVPAKTQVTASSAMSVCLAMMSLGSQIRFCCPEAADVRVLM